MTDTEAIDRIIEILWPTGDEALEWSSDEIEYVAEVIKAARPAEVERKSLIVDAIVFGIEA